MKCLGPWFHKWGKWMDYYNGGLVDTENNLRGRMFIQRRECQRCGRKNYRYERIVPTEF